MAEFQCQHKSRGYEDLLNIAMQHEILDEIFPYEDFIASKDKDTKPKTGEEPPNDAMDDQSDQNCSNPGTIESVLVGLVPHITKTWDDDCQDIFVVLW